MGKKAFSALSLLCRNAVEIMKVLSVNGGDDDFHTHDKTGCNDRAAPSLKMRSSPIHVWNSSHGIYIGLIIISGRIPPPPILSLRRGTTPAVARPLSVLRLGPIMTLDNAEGCFLERSLVIAV